MLTDLPLKPLIVQLAAVLSCWFGIEQCKTGQWHHYDTTTLSSVRFYKMQRQLMFSDLLAGLQVHRPSTLHALHRSSMHACSSALCLTPVLQGALAHRCTVPVGKSESTELRWQLNFWVCCTEGLGASPTMMQALQASRTSARGLLTFMQACRRTGSPGHIGPPWQLHCL